MTAVDDLILISVDDHLIEPPDLFDGRTQLFIKHFMMGPGQVAQCVGCSLEVDGRPATSRERGHPTRIMSGPGSPLITKPSRS